MRYNSVYWDYEYHCLYWYHLDLFHLCRSRRLAKFHLKHWETLTYKFGDYS